jgi:hypothetical protein
MMKGKFPSFLGLCDYYAHVLNRNFRSPNGGGEGRGGGGEFSLLEVSGGGSLGLFDGGIFSVFSEWAHFRS